MFQINWTISAARQRVFILLYWIKNNKSDLYSKKILKEITKIEKKLLTNHFLGVKTDFENVRRILVLTNFSLYYIVKEDCIDIVGFRDNRRDPENLEIK